MLDVIRNAHGMKTWQLMKGTLAGDVSGDGVHNVGDIVILSNCILTSSCPDLPNICAGALSGDNLYNIADIVQLCNCILNDTCDLLE